MIGHCFGSDKICLSVSVYLDTVLMFTALLKRSCPSVMSLLSVRLSLCLWVCYGGSIHLKTLTSLFKLSCADTLVFVFDHLAIARRFLTTRPVHLRRRLSRLF